GPVGGCDSVERVPGAGRAGRDPQGVAAAEECSDVVVTVDFHGMTLVDADGDGAPAPPERSEPHLASSGTYVRSNPRRSMTGASLNLKRSNCAESSACSDHGTQLGTAKRSPFSTASSSPPSTTVPLPSKTCHTEEPTSCRVRVSAPARRRWNSQR